MREESLDIDSDSSASSSTPRPTRNSPPQVDKWSRLGDVRRNYKPDERRNVKSREVFGPKRVTASQTRRHDWGHGSSGYRHGPQTKRESSSEARRRQLLEKDWRRHGPKPAHTNAYDGTVDDDLDLVGGWLETDF
jgi:hypothetical protein